MQDKAGTEIIGHRGAGGHAPENSEAALLAGIRLGATALEVDVQFTADGLPVIFHDRTLERMAGVRGRIREQTARELAGYDIGFRFGEDYRGLRILTLDECARLVPREIFLHVEIKDYDTVTPAHLKDVVASLHRRNALDRSLFSSFNEKILASLRGFDPGILLALLVSGRALGSVPRAAELGCFSLNPEAAQVDAALVEACHAQGLKVFPFTANEPGQMKHLIELGVDGIYTDFPGRLADIVGRKPITRNFQPRPLTSTAAIPAVGGGERRGRSSQGSAGRARPRGTRRDSSAPPRSVEAPVHTEPAALDADAPPNGESIENPAAGVADADAALPHKRRRGRRGGRRHKRKPATETGPDLVVPVDNPLPSPPLEALLDDDSGDDTGDDAGDEDSPTGGQEASTSPGDAPGTPVDPDRPKRRRGRRGGRRHRRDGRPPNPGSGKS